MSTFLKANADPSAPLSTMPYLENDGAIIRGVTRGMIDWSNALCYSGSGAIIGGSSFAGLTSGGGSASVTPNNPVAAFVALSGGMINTAGATSGGGYPGIILPSDFQFPTTTRQGLVSFWFKAGGATGWQANALLGLVGCAAGNNNLQQYQLFMSTNSSGVPTSLTFRIYGASGNIDCVLSGSALTALLDGNLHQVGVAVNIAGGNGQGFIYVDGALKASGSTGAMTQMNQPSGAICQFTTCNGVSGMTGSPSTTGAKMGRVAAWDLTGRSDLTFASVLAADIAATAGYLS